MAARSKAWVCGLWIAGIAGSNSAGAWTSVCCELYVLTGRGLCDVCPTECILSEGDRSTSTMRRPLPSRAVEQWKKNLPRRGKAGWRQIYVTSHQ